MGISTPQPTVLHLLTLFRQISAGQIRIPAFQRAFVWKEKQIIDLLDSVRSGFPIGSILLWHVERPILKIAAQTQTSFPTVEEKYPTNYVLDGMQRLSSLYGVFHYGSSTAGSKFNVWFDLLAEKFLHEEDLQFDQMDAVVPLAALFAPKSLISHQSKIMRLPNSDTLLDRLVNLQAAFQDYMVPAVVIGGEEVAPIVRVFESINSKGTTLSKVDFMRAITWAQDFDLSPALDSASRWLDEKCFVLPEETIVKCVGMILGIEPTAQSLLTLRTRSSSELMGAFNDFRTKFLSVHAFLRDEFCIQSNDYVPYEGQLLVLFKAISLENTKDAKALASLKRWFWATSFNESLRGKPDHYVVRAVNNWEGLIHGQIRGLEPRLRLVLDDFIERRLIKGKALSSAFISMFAAAGAQALTGEGRIEPSRYMRSGDPSVFTPILSATDIDTTSTTASSSTRLFANLVLDPDGKLAATPMFNAKNTIAALVKSGDVDPLRSQFIDEEAAACLSNGDYEEFLIVRAGALRTAANLLVETGELPNDPTAAS